MSFSVVLPIELADKNYQGVGSFFDEKLQGYSYSFQPPKKYKPTKQTFWCMKNLQGIVWTSGGLGYSELSKVLPRAAEGEVFARRTKKGIILGN